MMIRLKLNSSFNFCAGDAVQEISGMLPRYLMPLLFGALGLYIGLDRFIFSAGSVPLNFLTGRISTFFQTQFLITVLCVPLSVLLAGLILSFLIRIYRQLGLDAEKSRMSVAFSFAVMGIPFLTALLSNRNSPLEMGLWESLFLFMALNILNLLMLRISGKQAGMAYQDLLEISIILIFTGFYLSRKIFPFGLPAAGFNYLLIGFCFIIPAAIFLCASILRSMVGINIFNALMAAYAVFLSAVLVPLVFDLLSFLFGSVPVFLPAVTSAGLIMFLWGVRFLKRDDAVLESINHCVYFVIIPLIIICYLGPLMFSADPDPFGNWDNVMHKTSTTAYWTAELFLRGAKLFDQITPPGIGHMMYNAALLKLCNYDYAAIVNAKMLVYALGMVSFYFTIYALVSRKLVVLCLLLGLASYMPFYYDYNNWDMWGRHFFYWPGIAFGMFAIKHAGIRKFNYGFLFLSGLFTGLNVAMTWDIAILGILNLIGLIALLSLAQKPMAEKGKQILVLGAGFLITLIPFLAFMAWRHSLGRYFEYYLYLIKGFDVYASGRVWENASLVMWPTITTSYVYFNFMNIKIILSCLAVLVLLLRLLQRRRDAFTKILAIYIVQDLFFMLTRYTGGGDGGTLFYKSAMYGSLLLYAVFNHFFKDKNYFLSLCLLFAVVFSPNMIYPVSDADKNTEFGTFALNPTAYVNARENLPEKIFRLNSFDRHEQMKRFRSIGDRFKQVIAATPISYFDDSMPQMPPDFSKLVGISFYENFVVRRYLAKTVKIRNLIFPEDYGYVRSNQALDEFSRTHVRDTVMSLGPLMKPLKNTIVIDVFNDLDERREFYWKQFNQKSSYDRDIRIQAQSVLPDQDGMTIFLNNPYAAALMVIDYPYLAKNAPTALPLNRITIDGVATHIYPTIDKRIAVLVPHGSHNISVLNLAKSKKFIGGLIIAAAIFMVAAVFFLHGISRMITRPRFTH